MSKDYLKMIEDVVDDLLMYVRGGIELKGLKTYIDIDQDLGEFKFHQSECISKISLYFWCHQFKNKRKRKIEIIVPFLEGELKIIYPEKDVTYENIYNALNDIYLVAVKRFGHYRIATPPMLPIYDFNYQMYAYFGGEVFRLVRQKVEKPEKVEQWLT